MVHRCRGDGDTAEAVAAEEAKGGGRWMRNFLLFYLQRGEGFRAFANFPIQDPSALLPKVQLMRNPLILAWFNQLTARDASESWCSFTVVFFFLSFFLFLSPKKAISIVPP